jgi:hypothetical protein
VRREQGSAEALGRNHWLSRITGHITSRITPAMNNSDER